MAGNFTLTIIKPDAFGAGKAGKIIAHLEQQGFKVLAARVLHMSQAEAGEFYAVHKERPFYGSLVSFMTSGPCMPMVLEKADAVAALRDGDRRDRPGPGRRRHGPEAVRRVEGTERDPRQRQRRERGAGVALFLLGDGSPGGALAPEVSGHRSPGLRGTAIGADPETSDLRPET